MNDEQLMGFLKAAISGSHPQKRVRAWYKDEEEQILVLETSISDASLNSLADFEKRQSLTCRFNINSFIRKIQSDNMNREPSQRVPIVQNAILELLAKYLDDTLPLLLTQEFSALSNLLSKKITEERSMDY